MRFRLITYNIHKGIGGIDRRYRPERIIETLGQYAPDIVFLQEVDDGVPRSRGHRQVDLLSEALGLDHRAYQRNVKLTRGHYGNAIIARFPIIQSKSIDLTMPLKKRRRALFATCELSVPGRTPLLLVNCHLGLAGFERALQLDRLLSNESLDDQWLDTPMVVGGDYNDVWGTLATRCMEPAGFSGTSKHALTFPAVFPVRALDLLFFRGPIRLMSSFPSRSKIAREASDHLPLIADFEIIAQRRGRH